MTKIIINNPYFAKEYDAFEAAEVLESALHNVLLGNESFLIIHTKDAVIAVSPENCASVEIFNIEESFQYRESRCYGTGY